MELITAEVLLEWQKQHETGTGGGTDSSQADRLEVQQPIEEKSCDDKYW